MNSAAALKHFEDNPRATAKEAGITNAEANELVGMGRIIEVGKRITGKRGRPPAEYVVAGTVINDDAYVQEQVEKAKTRVEAHRHYERLSNAIMRAANEHGHGSDQHVEAKLLRSETFLVLPDLPSKNDYVLAGIIEVDPVEEVEELVAA
jgi:hypothetical protein